MKRASDSSIVGAPRETGALPHLSYSTLDSWFQCPKKVQLSKIQKAPALPAWWFAGGSAVHRTTELYDRWTLLDPVTRAKFPARDVWEESFDAEVAELDERGPEREQWRSAGPKAAPETYDRWKDSLGPELVKAYITWRSQSSWTIWHTEAGEPGIELDLGGQLPLAGLPIKAYVDRIFVDPLSGGLIIVDLKTGSRQPDGPLQFGVYNAGLALNHGVSAKFGYAFMNRKGELGKPFVLDKYTPAYVGRIFGHLAKAVESGIYPAHVGHACRMCDVSAACYAADGEFAELYDPDYPGYAPEF